MSIPLNLLAYSYTDIAYVWIAGIDKNTTNDCFAEREKFALSNVRLQMPVSESNLVTGLDEFNVDRIMRNHRLTKSGSFTD